MLTLFELLVLLNSIAITSAAIYFAWPNAPAPQPVAPASQPVAPAPQPVTPASQPNAPWPHPNPPGLTPDQHEAYYTLIVQHFLDWSLPNERAAYCLYWSLPDERAAY